MTLVPMPKELHDLIDYTVPGWAPKVNLTEEQKKQVVAFIAMVDKAQEDMIQVIR